jgi:anaerobic ribonucleoside-triphosphate reductase activating protein
VKLIINSIDYRGSIVDGPGIRTVLFLQGCEQKCPDCHNPSTWDIKNGKGLCTDEIAEDLRKNCLNKKLTISGGEPLLQFPAVLNLVKKLDDFNIVLYTGFEFKDVPKEILQYIDYIKVGNYIKEQRSTIIPFIGSKNQKFIELKSGKNEIN